MGLPWVRLDTQFPSNPKVLELTRDGKWRAAFVYIAGLTYAGQHCTDGYIPETAMPFIHATRTTASELVKVGLWHPDVGGWRVNDWEEHQMLDETAKARSDHARKAAQDRWAKRNGGSDISKTAPRNGAAKLCPMAVETTNSALAHELPESCKRPNARIRNIAPLV